jgi:hypothetical protein
MPNPDSKPGLALSLSVLNAAAIILWQAGLILNIPTSKDSLTARVCYAESYEFKIYGRFLESMSRMDRRTTSLSKGRQHFQ